MQIPAWSPVQVQVQIPVPPRSEQGQPNLETTPRCWRRTRGAAQERERRARRTPASPQSVRIPDCMRPTHHVPGRRRGPQHPAECQVLCHWRRCRRPAGIRSVPSRRSWCGVGNPAAAAAALLCATSRRDVLRRHSRGLSIPPSALGRNRRLLFPAAPRRRKYALQPCHVGRERRRRPFAPSRVRR